MATFSKGQQKLRTFFPTAKSSTHWHTQAEECNFSSDLQQVVSYYSAEPHVNERTERCREKNIYTAFRFLVMAFWVRLFFSFFFICIFFALVWLACLYPGSVMKWKILIFKSNYIPEDEYKFKERFFCICSYITWFIYISELRCKVNNQRIN